MTVVTSSNLRPHKGRRRISKSSRSGALPVVLVAIALATFCLAAIVLHHAASTVGSSESGGGRGRADDIDLIMQKKFGNTVVRGGNKGIGGILKKTTSFAKKSQEYVSKKVVTRPFKVAKKLVEEVEKSFVGSLPRPDEMESVGDKSSAYRRLRKEFDERFPDEPWDASWTPEAEADTDAHRRRLELMKELRKRDYEPVDFDNDSDCPPTPSPDYPKAFRMEKIIENWNPDDTKPRKKIYQGICRFDYVKDYEKIMAYRNAEKPFVVRDDPRVLRTVERWNDPTYLHRLLNDKTHRTEYSLNNHFMYWNMGMARRRPGKHGGGGGAPKGWKPPTEMIEMSYPQWFEKANVTDDKLGPDNPHWYFRLIGCGDMRSCDKKTNSESLFDELPFFQPQESVYIVEPKAQRGIHCRFGMRGVIAENHYDGSRNMVALLGGERRYILAHPDQCTPLYLLPKGHPSGRHSAVDWSNPDWEAFPDFAGARANEIVMQAGDVLYLPTFWFHYIISLEINFQCNTRSGIEYSKKVFIDQCEPYMVPQ